MSAHEGRAIAAVTVGAMVVAFAVAGGITYAARGAGLPWWIVSPVAWVALYLIMRTILRSFFARRMPAS